MRACDAVIISNPHNPTGQVIQATDLAAVAARHPASLLVADESYIDFLADPAPITLIGCGLGNVIVLRSPSKFFGLAGARSGVAWSLHPLPGQWRHTRTSWPVSAFAATGPANSARRQRLGRQHTPAPGQRHRVARRGTDRYRAGDHPGSPAFPAAHRARGRGHQIRRSPGLMRRRGAGPGRGIRCGQTGRAHLSTPPPGPADAVRRAAQPAGRAMTARRPAEQQLPPPTGRQTRAGQPVPGQREATEHPGMGSVASRRQDALVAGHRLPVLRTRRA